MFRSVITGTGCYIPPVVQSNEKFARQAFYTESQKLVAAASPEVIEKFREITGIEERRYTADELTASDIGAIAAENAIRNSEIDREQIDQLIVAHNFGNVEKNTIQTNAVPSLSSLIKNRLGIRNASCIPYDILFGCPGWVQGMIQADAFFKAGIAKKALIVGTETLSRVIDRYDRDSMIFSDGSGAAVLEYREAGNDGPGVLGASVQSHCAEEVNYIYTGASYFPDSAPSVRYLKMKGRKVYEYALKHVPAAMKDCVDKSGVNIHEIKKIFIHQANEKMDEGIVSRFYRMFGISSPPPTVMPMSIHWLGNSSVATIPTLYDLVRREEVNGHRLISGDIIIFASVGAGMNINAVCYRY